MKVVRYLLRPVAEAFNRFCFGFGIGDLRESARRAEDDRRAELAEYNFLPIKPSSESTVRLEVRHPMFAYAPRLAARLRIREADGLLDDWPEPGC